MEAILPPDWSWRGRRVLDFGCGTGKVLSQFADEATKGRVLGLRYRRSEHRVGSAEHVPTVPSLRLSRRGRPTAARRLFRPHLCLERVHAPHRSLGRVAAEHHRVLADGGLLFASFIGEGMVEGLISEEWCEDRIGMNILNEGNPWDSGGPTIIHSPWWLRAHWGRAFEILDIWPYTVAGRRRPTAEDAPTPTHGMILLRRKPVRLTVEDLTRLEPDEPREISALQHNVRQLRDEEVALRRQGTVQLQPLHGDDGQRLEDIAELRQRLRGAQEDLVRHRAWLGRIQGSASWRLTSPARAAKQRLNSVRTALRSSRTR